MYTFLPAMKGANAALLIQAIHEMGQRYSRLELAQHLTRFARIMERSTTVSEQDKQRVKEELHNMEYDSLIDDNPDVQERIARAELRALQETVVEAVSEEYPPLAELAQQQVTHLDKPEDLRKLVKLIYRAPDEATVRWLLDNFAA